MLLAASAAVLPVALGCSASAKESGVGASLLPNGARSEAIEHEACDDKANRVETLDTNNDGKDDIRRVYDKKTGKEICRIVDLNHDGKPDMYEYFDANGDPRRREYAYDESGVVNAIEYYEQGKLVRREYDTTGQHRIDTWDYFDPSKPVDPKTGRPRPVRRERDTTGDGRIDQWWTWDGEKITIAFDKNGDGKPDPESVIVLNDNDAGAPVDNGGPTASTDGGATPSTTPEAGAAPMAADASTGDGGSK